MSKDYVKEVIENEDGTIDILSKKGNLYKDVTFKDVFYDGSRECEGLVSIKIETILYKEEEK